MKWQMIKWRLQGSIRSLTIWVNGLFGALLLGLPDLQASLPQLQSYVPADAFRYAMGVVIVANILLRFKTNKDLAAK